MGERLVLRSGATSVTVDPSAGARLASVVVRGHELLVGPTDDPLTWGCYPMAPWVGRTRDGRFTFEGRDYALERNLGPDAIHGTVFDRPWVVTMLDAAGCEMTCPLGPGWPFAGAVTHRIAVSPAGLRLELRIEAEDRMPACLGWHPWFARGGGVAVDFEGAGRCETDRPGMPTGRVVAVGPRPAAGWDDCFTGVRQPVRVAWPGVLEVALTASATHWVQYDQPAHAVCLEPQTATPDALNLGCPVVEAGGSLGTAFDWTWRL